MQLELDFESIPGIINLAPYLQRSSKPLRDRKIGNAVTAFPLSRRRSTIQHVAQQFKSRRGKKRLQFWHETVERLSSDLRTAGVPEHAVRAELIAFRDAVELALDPQASRSGTGAK